VALSLVGVSLLLGVTISLLAWLHALGIESSRINQRRATHDQPFCSLAIASSIRSTSGRTWNASSHDRGSSSQRGRLMAEPACAHDVTRRAHDCPNHQSFDVRTRDLAPSHGPHRGWALETKQSCQPLRPNAGAAPGSA
jgi:hypothetical protein